MLKKLSVLVVLAIIFAIVFGACGEAGGDPGIPNNPGDEGPGNGEPVWELGEKGPSGGLIFYVHDEPEGFYVEGYGVEGQPGFFEGYYARYMEYAPDDVLQDTVWEIGVPGSFTDISGTEEGLGLGRKNTAIIIASHAAIMPAAVASAVTIEGISGWFLPSKDELALLTGSMWGYPDVNMSGDYWSSTQYDSEEAYFAIMAKGANNASKDELKNVRPIRAFW